MKLSKILEVLRILEVFREAEDMVHSERCSFKCCPLCDKITTLIAAIEKEAGE